VPNCICPLVEVPEETRRALAGFGRGPVEERRGKEKGWERRIGRGERKGGEIFKPPNCIPSVIFRMYCITVLSWSLFQAVLLTYCHS